MMFLPIRSFWWALGQLYYDLIPLALRVNILWSLTVLPLTLTVTLITIVLSRPEVRDGIADRRVPLDLLLMAPLLTVIVLLLAGPGTAALYNSIYRFTELEPVSFRMFARGFRRFFIRGWLVGVVDLIALFVFAVGFMFYWFSGQLFLQIIAVIFVYFLLFWALMQPYLYPLMVTLDLGVYHTFRNAAVLVVGNPGATLGLGIISVISLVALPIFTIVAMVLGPAVLALTGVRVTGNLLEEYGVSPDENGFTEI